MPTGHAALTEKEKQTLRLIVRDHDAKSIARHLGLSVHTINERLRDARRKLEVSSSREAARLLLQQEGQHPDSAAYNKIGDAPPPDDVSTPAPPDIVPARPRRSFLIASGALLMSFTLALLALASQSPSPATDVPATAANPEAAAAETIARQ